MSLKEGFGVGFRWVVGGVGFLWETREKGKWLGRVGVGWGHSKSTRMRLSKLPFSKLPFRKVPDISTLLLSLLPVLVSEVGERGSEDERREEKQCRAKLSQKVKVKKGQHKRKQRWGEEVCVYLLRSEWKPPLNAADDVYQAAAQE